MDGDKSISINNELNNVVELINQPRPKYITSKMYKKYCNKKNYDKLYAILHNNITKYKDIYSIYFLGLLHNIKDTKYYDKNKALKYIKLVAHLDTHTNYVEKCNVQYSMGKLCESNNLISHMLYWYKMAAHNGHPMAMFLIGKYYYDSQYLKHSQKKGLDWLTRSASCNNINALNKLGDIMFKQGDYNASFKYYKQSHDLGNIVGTRNIALYYITGKGIQQNLVLGKIYMDDYYNKTKDDQLYDIYIKELRKNELGIFYYLC